MSIGSTLFGWIVGPIIKQEIRKMIDKYLKPLLDFAGGLAPRVLILVLTFGSLGGLIYLKMESPWLIGAVTLSGGWAQWINYKVQATGVKNEKSITVIDDDFRFVI